MATNAVKKILFFLPHWKSHRFLFLQDPDSDAKEVEKWLNLQAATDTEAKSDTSNAFNDFLQKRASTIPVESVSEQEIHLDVDPTPNKYSIN